MSADAASIPCPVCLHTGTFNTVETLKERLIFVSTNKIVCPVCQEEVNGLDKLTIHLFSHVNISAIVQEDRRQKDYKQGTNQEAQVPSAENVKKIKQSIPKNKSYALAAPVKFVKIYPKLPVVALNTMPVINSNVTNNSLLITTIESNCPIEKNNNKCNICGVQFINEEILKMHNSIIHNLEDKTTQPTKYNCHLCPKYFKMRGSLMVHLRVAHYGFTQKLESDLTDTGSNNVNEKTEEIEKPMTLCRNDGKQWQCDVCNKYFTTKYFLKKHKRLHTGETPYACSQCNKTFTFQQSYHKHLLYHNDDKPHTCTYCGRAFKELSTLHNHQRIHTGEKPFACETCGKCFRQRVSYLVHRRIHTGAMPYKCTACDKSFRYKVSQRTHKCQSQPPGTVIRKSGEFVEKLKKTKRLPNSSPKSQNESIQHSYPEVSEANAELVRTGAQLSLEDMESENFSIISDSIVGNSHGINMMNNIASISHKKQGKSNSYNSEIDELIDSIPVQVKNIPSPSDILKNLCLTNEDDYLSILD
ncbi:unnamed protein product [Pieris macdunnoughi]|uniref:C2H2-type domain-containing protein n=1 Tax=Pieris macdunnoughi TaxID=345717 RepID=A0A821N3L8_9NEOP|nr:unnamed protein product [Pieris macdunnoughi]